MDLKIKLTHENAVLPFKKHATDACYDLTAVSMETVNKDDHGYVEYDLGIATEIPKGWCALLFPRSSVSNTGLFLANCVGVIDHEYRASWKARFKYIPGTRYYEPGERVCQFMLIPTTQLNFIVVDEVSVTERNLGGFGSTNQ